MADNTHYLFIDGGYLRRRYQDAMNRIFKHDGVLNFVQVRSHCERLLEAPVSRTFYYDCLDDLRKADDTQESYDSRVAANQQWLDSIQALGGFFVKQGTLVGSRKGRARQKKIDVQLAVDVLEHSFRRNCETACLLAGDLDFLPIVESLVHAGTYVKVLYVAEATNPELWRSADRGIAIDIPTLYAFSDPTFFARYKLPRGRRQQGDCGPSGRVRQAREGFIGSARVYLFDPYLGAERMLTMYDQGYTQTYEHDDEDILLRFVTELHGEPQWSGRVVAP